MLLTYATTKEFPVHQMDVDNAYLNAPLDEEIYLKPPPQLQHKWPGKVLRVKKALYGLKQSAHAWNKLLTFKLGKLGWTSNPDDPCLFMRSVDGSTQFLAVYVDDLVLVAKDDEAIFNAKAEIGSLFRTKDLGRVEFILGMSIAYDQEGRIMELCQKALIQAYSERFKIVDSEKKSTPMKTHPGWILNTGECDEGDRVKYQELIGALLYVSQRTRPDIANAVNILSRFTPNPSEDHIMAARRILGYLVKTVDLRFVLRGKDADEIRVEAFWSTTGYAIYFGGGLCLWRSQKQNCVAASTAESEYVALSECAKTLAWMVRFLENLGLKGIPVTINCDNKAAIAQASVAGINNKSKHIDVRYHLVKALHEEGLFDIKYVESQKNVADILTKPLPKDSHHAGRQRLGVLPARGNRRSVGILPRQPSNHIG
jgi:hypothetical protein